MNGFSCVHLIVAILLSCCHISCNSFQVNSFIEQDAVHLPLSSSRPAESSWTTSIGLSCRLTPSITSGLADRLLRFRRVNRGNLALLVALVAAGEPGGWSSGCPRAVVEASLLGVRPISAISPHQTDISQTSFTHT